MFVLAIVFVLLLIYERRGEITLVVDLQQCNCSKFCTRRDKVGVNEDVKETVIRRVIVSVTKVSRKRDY